jgi:CRP-like cAMP-binding protein
MRSLDQIESVATAPARAALRAMLARDAAAAALPPADACALAGGAALQWPRPGEGVGPLGDRALVYVVTGAVRVDASDGGSTAIVGAGWLLPLPTLGVGVRGVRAQVPSVLAAWPATAPTDGPGGRLLAALVRRDTDRLLALAWRKAALVGASLRARVAHELATLAVLFGRPRPGGVLVDPPVTHADLARLVGATRANVTRVLAGLRADDVVRVEDGRLVVVAREAARPWAAADAAEPAMPR